MQGVRISLDKQLVNHGITFSRITKSLGSKDSATQHLNKCLYYVGMGSNDYLNNYYMPQNYNTSQNLLQSNTLKLLLHNMVTKSRLVALVQYVSCSIPLHILEPSLNFFFFFPIDFAQLWSKEGCNIWSRTDGLHSICNYITWHKWFFVRGYI